MNNAIFGLIFTVCAAGVAMAQSDYKKGEFFIGYSQGQVEANPVGAATQASTGQGSRETFHGATASGVYNFSRYFGLKADVSGVYNSTHFSFPVGTGTATQTVVFDSKRSLYNVLGGVQVKDNSNDKVFKPFAHALVGLGRASDKISNKTCTTTNLINCGQINSVSENGLAFAFGGGLDIKLSDRIDLRAFQVDYNPITFDESTTNNIRFGIGIVIK